MEDWTDVMYVAMYGCDKYSYGDVNDWPRCENPGAWGWLAGFYFIFFIIFSSLIMLNLVIGTICSSMAEADDNHSLGQECHQACERIMKETTKSGKSTGIPGIQMEVLQAWIEGFKLMDSNNEGMGLPSINKDDLQLLLQYLGEQDTLTNKRREHLLVKANHTLPIGKISMTDFLHSLASDCMDEHRKAKMDTTGYITIVSAANFSDGTKEKNLDVYCKLFINDKDCGTTTIIEHVEANTGVATWNERIGYPGSILNEDGVNRFQIQLFDHDKFSKDDYIGEVALQFNSWDAMQVDEKEEELHSTGLSSRKLPITGSLRFSSQLPKERPSETRALQEAASGIGKAIEKDDTNEGELVENPVASSPVANIDASRE